MTDVASAAQMRERDRWSNLIDPSADALPQVHAAAEQPGSAAVSSAYVAAIYEKLSEHSRMIAKLTIRVAELEKTRVVPKDQPVAAEPIHNAISAANHKPPMVAPLGIRHPK